MQKNRAVGAVALISGTVLGAGMLALPVATAFGGFYYTVITFFICWLFMTYSALLMLEVNLWFAGSYAHKEINLLTMAKRTLGTPGKIITWFSYLLLLYSLISAYITTSGAWLAQFLSEYTNEDISTNTSILVVTIFFALCITYGTFIVDKINRILALGLILAYSFLIVVASPHVEFTNIGFGNLSVMPSTTTLIVA